MNKKTKKILPRLLIAIVFVSMFFLPQTILAINEEYEGNLDDGCNVGAILPACTCAGNCRLTDMLVLGVNIFQLAISLLGAVAVGFIMLAGLMMMTSGGNPQRLEMGKKILSGSFAGTAIVMGTWLIINTIYFFASGGTGTVFGEKWFALKEYPPIELSTSPVCSDDADVCIIPSCSNMQSVALSHNPPSLFPRDESQALKDLRNCIETRINMAMVDTSQIYTYERTNDVCNYSRGVAMCGVKKCAHSEYSCHYGGRTGTTGAMAVDYNARPGYTEAALKAAIVAVMSSDCGQFGWVVNERGPLTHTHVSATGCDSR